MSPYWRVQDFVNYRKAFRLFSEEPTYSRRSAGITRENFVKSAASQSPSKICRAAAVGKIATRRLISRKRFKPSTPGIIQ